MRRTKMTMVSDHWSPMVFKNHNFLQKTFFIYQPSVPMVFFSLATIGLDGFAMGFGLATIGLNRFSMAANHWSNDRMVTIHCYGLFSRDLEQVLELGSVNKSFLFFTFLCRTEEIYFRKIQL